ncbi:MAG: hypothetical protein ACXAC2_10905 [Candidatus Kariarchaeaceae archaeon]|jgi:hypothetical protein
MPIMQLIDFQSKFQKSIGLAFIINGTVLFFSIFMFLSIFNLPEVYESIRNVTVLIMFLLVIILRTAKMKAKNKELPYKEKMINQCFHEDIFLENAFISVIIVAILLTYAEDHIIINLLLLLYLIYFAFYFLLTYKKIRRI